MLPISPEVQKEIERINEMREARHMAPLSNKQVQAYIESLEAAN